MNQENVKSVVYVFAGVGIALAGLLLSSFFPKSSPPSERHKQRGFPQTPDGQSQSPSGATPPQGTDNATPEHQHFVTLLYWLAEDQARKEGFTHRGITCNNCQACPIKGIRYKCANCVDYDLCEACEGNDVHLKTHVFIKLRVPLPPLANPKFSLLSVLYPGGKGTSPEVLPSDGISELQKKTAFDQYELEGLYEEFKALAIAHNGVNGIDKQTFDYCLGPIGLDHNLIPERIFRFFDQDKDGLISFAELVCGLSVRCKGSYEEKLHFAFKGYDVDEDGFISSYELTQMYKAYFRLSMELIRDVVRVLEEELMANFDEESDKPVSASFNHQIPQGESDQEHPGKTEEFSVVKQDGLYRGMRPVVEDISQDAIDELVQKTFEIAKPENGLLSFEDFRNFAMTDTTILSWFEALGTVF